MRIGKGARLDDARRVVAALDDLARELMFYLEQTSDAQAVVEDPQGSLYETLYALEASFPQPSATRQRKSAASVMEIMEALPAEQRELLRLHLGEGLTCLEIAEGNKRDRHAVLLDLVRAYGHLRLHLGGEHLASIYGRGHRSDD